MKWLTPMRWWMRTISPFGWLTLKSSLLQGLAVSVNVNVTLFEVNTICLFGEWVRAKAYSQNATSKALRYYEAIWKLNWRENKIVKIVLYWVKLDWEIRKNSLKMTLWRSAVASKVFYSPIYLLIYSFF